VAFVNQDHVGIAVGRGVKRIPAKFLHADDLSGDGSVVKFPSPHFSQRGRTDHDGLLAAVVGEIFQELLANPGLAQANGVGDQNAVVAGQDAAGFLGGIFLELGQVHGAAPKLRGILAKLFPEVFVEGLRVDLVGRVLLGAELAGVQKLDEVVFEVHRVGPLPFVPGHQVGDRPRPDLTLDGAAGAVGYGSSLQVLLVQGFIVMFQVGNPLRSFGVERFFGGRNDPVDQIQFFVADQPRPGEVAGADDGGVGAQAICPVVRPCSVLMKQVRLGVQEALVIEPDFHLIGPQEGDQFLDQLQRGFVEGLGFEIALKSLLQRIGVRTQADIGPGVRLGPQEQPKRTDFVQPFLDQPVAGDGEVGCGDVQGLADALAQ
jgi:hypothetical protein